jgi:(p)ppGpp synthase/HD superfamily hydrolase
MKKHPIILEAEAMLFVQERHNPNQKYGDYPYFFHLYQVVSIAREFGFDDEEIILALWLHDAQEDTFTSYNDIKQRFGERVADITYAVTDAKGKNRKEKHANTYPAIREDKKAVIVKQCDRLGNIRFSKATGEKIDMYRKEQPEFYRALHRDDMPEAEPLWDAIQKELDSV